MDAWLDLDSGFNVAEDVAFDDSSEGTFLISRLPERHADIVARLRMIERILRLRWMFLIFPPYVSKPVFS